MFQNNLGTTPESRQQLNTKSYAKQSNMIYKEQISSELN